MKAETTASIVANPAHAYLISGASEYEISEFAESLAKQLANTHSEGDVVKNITVLETEDTSITTKQISSMLAKTQLTQGGKNRVFVIKQADKLTLSASNSLLKSLEEPGENTIFLLLSTKPHTLKPTVRSRLQHINLGSSEQDALDNILKLEDEQTSKVIKTVSFGDPTLAQYHLDNKDKLLEDVALIKSVFMSDYYDRVILLKPYWKDKASLVSLIDKMLAIARAAMHSSSGMATKAFHWNEKAAQCLRAKERLEKNVSPRAVIMELMIQL